MLSSYEILGISSNATLDEIKVAYRRLSVKAHPDKNNGDKASEAYFKLLNEAYETCCKNYKKSDRQSYEPPRRQSTPPKQQPPFTTKAKGPIPKWKYKYKARILWGIAAVYIILGILSLLDQDNPQKIARYQQLTSYVGFSLGQSKEDVFSKNGKPLQKENDLWTYDFSDFMAAIHFSDTDTANAILVWNKTYKHSQKTNLKVGKKTISIGDKIGTVIRLISPNPQDFTVRKVGNSAVDSYKFVRWHVICRCTSGVVQAIMIYS